MKHLLIVILAAIAGPGVAMAQSWTQSAAINNSWKLLGASADGTKMVALDNVYGIYASTNSGKTWQTATNGPVLSNSWWTSLACSADGGKWVATAYYSPAAPGNGGMFVSTNGGIGWAKTNSMMGLSAVACSADGRKIAALGDSIFYSTNCGSNWTQASSLNNYWTAIAVSADGAGVAASRRYDGMYVSTNSGGLWSQRSSPTYSWVSLAMSADGRRLAAVDSGKGVYTSTDFAASWVSNALPAAVWCSVASSADGKRLIAAATNGLVYASTNWGLAWVSNSVPSNHWSAVTSSADGCKFAAAANGGGIYISYTPPAPQLSIAASNRFPVFSWTVASTNLVVQVATNLMRPSWTRLTNVAVLDLTNLQYRVSATASNALNYYRLATP